jgi:hypothetical protein
MPDPEAVAGVVHLYGFTYFGGLLAADLFISKKILFRVSFLL